MDNNLPPLIPGESIIRVVEGTEFKLTMSHDTISSKAFVCLTSHRLIFVPDGSVSFGILLENITNESFNQPIFTPNNFAGDCLVDLADIEHSQLHSHIPAKFKISFYEGNEGEFAAIGLRMIRGVRKAIETQREQLIAVQNSQTTQQEQAYVSPTNPQVMYLPSARPMDH